MWCTYTVVENAEQAQYNIYNVHRDKKNYQQFNEKLTVTHHVDIKKGSSITMWNWKMHPHAHAHTHTRTHPTTLTHTLYRLIMITTFWREIPADYNFLKGNPSWPVHCWWWPRRWGSLEAGLAASVLQQQCQWNIPSCPRPPCPTPAEKCHSSVATSWWQLRIRIRIFTIPVQVYKEICQIKQGSKILNKNDC